MNNLHHKARFGGLFSDNSVQSLSEHARTNNHIEQKTREGPLGHPGDAAMA